MPYPGLLHPEPLPLQQFTADPCLLRRYTNTVLFQTLWGVWVLVHTRYEPYLWRVCGLVLNVIPPFLPSCWAFSFALDIEYLLKVAPVLHSRCSSAYCFAWVSLTLGVGYLFTAAPAKCSHSSLPWRRAISSQLLSHHAATMPGPPGT